MTLTDNEQASGQSTSGVHSLLLQGGPSDQRLGSVDGALPHCCSQNSQAGIRCPHDLTAMDEGHPERPSGSSRLAPSHCLCSKFMQVRPTITIQTVADGLHASLPNPDGALWNMAQIGSADETAGKRRDRIHARSD